MYCYTFLSDVLRLAPKHANAKNTTSYEYIDLAKPKSGAPLFCFVCLFVCLFVYCWQLLICENTLIQVVKLKKQKEKKKQKKKFLPSLESNSGRRCMKSDISPLGHDRSLTFYKLILILISFFVTSCPSA